MRSKYRDFRGVAEHVGAVVMVLGAGMIVSALGGWAANVYYGPDELSSRRGELSLLVAAAVTIPFGAAAYFYGKRHATETLQRRHATLAVVLIWFAAGVFGGVPFVIDANMAPHDAWFESVSGLTTTGATVITDIEGRLSRPLLLWRSLIQWFGGMGIVVLFVAIFPSIGAGGKHMFGEEVPGTTVEGLKPRIKETSKVLWKLYALLTLLEILVLSLLGVPVFESICHAFTTLSTGGFSTRDASVAAFGSAPVELAVTGFMLLASVNYSLYYATIKGKSLKAFWRSIEFRTFVIIVVVCTLIVTLGILEKHGNDLFQAFRYASFMVATFVSSTGYTTDAYMEYLPPILFVLIVVMFIGGCAGSTAGGIKMERMVLMAKSSWALVRRTFRPSLVQVVRMGRNVVQQSALTDAAVFFMIYMMCMAVWIGAVTATEGASVETAFGAVLTCLSNMGPAPFHVGADNFASYSGFSKYFLALAMLLGRLEFFTVLALLVPGFWRR